MNIPDIIREKAPQMEISDLEKYNNRVWNLLSDMKPGADLNIEKITKPESRELFVECCKYYMREHEYQDGLTFRKGFGSLYKVAIKFERTSRLRKIIGVLFMIILSCSESFSQGHGISLVIGTSDRGAGIMYDNQKRGFYVSASAGSYPKMGNNIAHLKTAAGLAWYCKQKDPNIQTVFSAGLNQHLYGKGKDMLSKLTLFPISIEAGAAVILYRRYRVGATFDPVKIEGQFNIGIYLIRR